MTERGSVPDSPNDDAEWPTNRTDGELASDLVRLTRPLGEFNYEARVVVAEAAERLRAATPTPPDAVRSLAEWRDLVAAVETGTADTPYESVALAAVALVRAAASGSPGGPDVATCSHGITLTGFRERCAECGTVVRECSPLEAGYALSPGVVVAWLHEDGDRCNHVEVEEGCCSNVGGTWTPLVALAGSPGGAPGPDGAAS